jgi:hypothetical protein
VARANARYTFLSCHEHRLEVDNDLLDRWEEELLSDLVATVAWSLQLQVTFTRAQRVRAIDVSLGWLETCLLDTHQVLWVLGPAEKA